MPGPSLTVPLVGSLDDPQRARDLATMKRLATGLFLVAAAVFLACVLLGADAGAWVGYVRATAEASMVGALADWFAVTALFRHPLGVPIPHTAIIPRKKDQIGTSLGTFVQENFLTRAVVEERLGHVDVPGRLGAFLAAPGRAERLAGDAGAALGALSDLIADDEVQQAVSTFVDRKLRETPAAPGLARVLELAVDGNRHQEVLSAGLSGLAEFLADNRLVFRTRLGDASPAWVPDWVDDKVFDRVFELLRGFLAEVGADPDSQLRARMASVIRSGARLLTDDPTVRELVQRNSLRAAGWAVERFAADAAELVGTTVARWDTEETSRRIELQVGRDLQFIRVNGTVVGGLAGLVIYTIAQLIS